MNELELYIEDFESYAMWKAVCESVGVDGSKVSHVQIPYIKEMVRAYDVNGDEV